MLVKRRPGDIHHLADLPDGMLFLLVEPDCQLPPVGIEDLGSFFNPARLRHCMSVVMSFMIPAPELDCAAKAIFPYLA